MTDPETQLRKAEQARALDVSRHPGALITSQYLERRQEVVAVNKTDLEDILSFDGISAFFSSFGMLFLAGSTWLAVDKILGAGKFELTPVVTACLFGIILGIVFLVAGIFFWIRKRGRINKIFKETIFL